MSARSKLALLGTTLVAVFAMSASTACAQPGRGGPPGSGFSGGGGFDFRGMMLRRMDANGNGVIEPNEVSDRARGFLERMAREAGVDPNRPMPIDRLTGSGGSRHGDRSRSASDDRRREEERRREQQPRGGGGKDRYPKVPPFGESDVPGFGANPMMLDGKVVDLEKKYDRRVLEYAQGVMNRYDKNKNGILEHSEWADVSWRSDPRESDLDKDGRLTKAEMAERIAKRFSGRDGSSSSSASRYGSRGDSDRGDRNEGHGGSSSHSRYGSRGGSGFGDPSEHLSRLDKNGDGTIEPSEVDERVRRFIGYRFQIDLSKPVRVDEVRKRLAQRDGRNRRDGENGGGDDAESDDAAYRVEGVDRLKGRMSYRSVGPALPPLLPDWWDRKDDNADGQVTMAEFMTFPSDSAAEEFMDYDSNGDGVITSREAEIEKKDAEIEKKEAEIEEKDE